MTDHTLPAVEFVDVLREGCALVLTRDLDDTRGGTWLYGTGIVYLRAGSGPTNPITEIPAAITVADVAIDCTRASGQWAVACWLADVWIGRDRNDTLIKLGLLGRADPAELCRVAREVRGG